MIIVKAEKETVFVNDKNYHFIEHDKARKVAHLFGKSDNSVMEDVESVIYVNDAQAFEFKDDGSELERALHRLSLLTQIKELSRKSIYKIFDFYRVLGIGAYEFDSMPKEEITKVVDKFNELKNKALEAWANFNKEYTRLADELKRI